MKTAGSAREHMTAVAGIVFDLDGVLIASAPAHRAAFEQVLATLDIHDFVYSRYAGWRTPDVFREILTEKHHPAAASHNFIARLAAQKSHLARQLLESSDPIVPGCVPVLETLAHTYPLALASSASRASVDSFLTRTATRPLFRSVLCGDDVHHAKPDPEIYQRSFALLQLAPADGLVVEDAVSGVEAARRAGTAVVVGIAGTCSMEHLVAAGAHTVVENLTELRDLLGCPA